METDLRLPGKRLEHLIAPRRETVEILPGEHPIGKLLNVPAAGDECDLYRRKIEVGVGVDRNPGARVAAFMEAVVDKARVAPNGNPPPCSIQVGLGADRILEIAEVIAE